MSGWFFLIGCSPLPPPTAAALARLRPPLSARQRDPVYCLSICRHWGRPNQDVQFITSACLGTSGRFQRCLEVHRTDAQGPASPFATVSFKDGEKEHEIAKSQDIFAFVLPSERDQESGSACSCSLRAHAGERRMEKISLSVPADPTAAWVSNEECFTAGHGEEREKLKEVSNVPPGAAAGRQIQQLLPGATPLAPHCQPWAPMAGPLLHPATGPAAPTTAFPHCLQSTRS